MRPALRAASNMPSTALNAVFSRNPLCACSLRVFGPGVALVGDRSSSGHADKTDDYSLQTDCILIGLAALTHFDFAINQFGPI
jgi:hypothetical protein